MIDDTFGQYGTAYRIGGDEFSVIVTKLTNDVAEDIRTNISKRLEEESAQGPYADNTFNMGIAAGYTQFDKALDTTLNDTLKRADAIMYENKSTMKHRGHNRADD